MESAWIDDAKDLFIKHYVEILAPEMLWRYGLDPRPSDMNPNVLTIVDLKPSNVLKPSKRNDPRFKALEASKKGPKDQGLKEPEASEDT